MSIRTMRRRRQVGLAALVLAGGVAAMTAASATASDDGAPTSGVVGTTGDGPVRDAPADGTGDLPDAAETSVVKVSLDEDGTLWINGVEVDPADPPADLPFDVHVDGDHIEVHARD